MSKQTKNRKIIIMPQVVETTDGIAITDPCLWRQIEKAAAERGATPQDAVISALNAKFGA